MGGSVRRGIGVCIVQLSDLIDFTVQLCLYNVFYCVYQERNVRVRLFYSPKRLRSFYFNLYAIF